MFPVGSGSQISRYPVHEAGKVISPTHPLPENVPDTRFCYRLGRRRDHGVAGRIMSMKNSVTLSGIEPAAFRIVAQCLDQLRHQQRAQDEL
jgi:hypothetical protein